MSTAVAVYKMSYSMHLSGHAPYRHLFTTSLARLHALPAPT